MQELKKLPPYAGIYKTNAPLIFYSYLNSRLVQCVNVFFKDRVLDVLKHDTATQTTDEGIITNGEYQR